MMLQEPKLSQVCSGPHPFRPRKSQDFASGNDNRSGIRYDIDVPRSPTQSLFAKPGWNLTPA